MKILGTIILAVGLGTGIAVAPPAAATESAYLARLQPEYTNLSAQQLLTEGYRVCRYIGAGRESSDAIPMVTKDLGVSVPTAFELVPAAIEELNC
jgi:hypothetical protein